MKKNVSIVVPIYNVEQYLKRCLDSLLEQSYPYLEIICINDGSTDNSLEIIKEYSKKDARIKVISRENKGLLATRIEGVKESNGDYLIFVDSDDWVDKNYVQMLIEDALKNDSDIVRCNYKNVNEKNEVKLIKNFENNVIVKEKFVDTVFLEMCKTDAYNTVSRQLIRLEKVKKIVDDIDSSIALGEDLEFNINLYKEISKISTLDFYGYNYRYNTTSISRSLNKDRLRKNLKDELTVYKHFVDFIKKNESEYLKKIAYIRYLYQINSHLSRLVLCKDISKTELKKEVYNISSSNILKEIREEIKLTDFKLLRNKKAFLAKLLYKDNLKCYLWIVRYVYPFLLGL